MTPPQRPARDNSRYRSLFDTDWYRSRYAEVNHHPGGPFAHYVSGGWASGYAPNPFFDPGWYRERYPEVARAGLDPFLDYVTRGEALGHRPNPLFHTKWYAARNGLREEDSPLAHFVAQSSSGNQAPNPLFDPAFYREENSAALNGTRDPLSHYLETGSRSCRPHPLFDTAWYLDRYPGVAASGANPLAHFLEVGGTAGYWPNPYFDSGWYRKQYLGEQRDETNPLVHFIETGAAKGHRPHPFFDTPWYLDRYPRVAHSDQNPLGHFHENRGAPTGAESEWEPNALLDSHWYRAQHVELLASERTFAHQNRSRVRRSVPPNPHFETYAKFFASYSEGIRAHDRQDNPLRDYFAAGFADPFHESQEVCFEETSDPEVTIVVPAFNQFSHTLACLRSIGEARTRSRFEVLLADDASDEVDFAGEFEAVGGLRLIRASRNRGFLETCNAAAREARGHFLVFLNNDTIVMDDWLDELLATLHRFPDVGAVGSKLLFPNGRIAEAGGVVFADGTAWNYGRRRAASDLEVDYAREVDYVSAASLLVERSFFFELGGFHEIYRPGYYEDTDLAFRVRRAGRRVLYQPTSRVIHFEGVSSRTETANTMKAGQFTNRGVFFEQWRNELEGRRAPGEDADLEKDRYAPRNALFLDVGLPFRTRDARSLRLVEMMKIVRDEGCRVTFFPENLDAPEPFATELRGLGFRVVTAYEAGSVAHYLAQEGGTIDLVVVARRPLASRWIETIRRHCPNARILFDAIDLIEPETLETACRDLRSGRSNPLKHLLEHVDASLVASENPARSSTRRGHGDDTGSQSIYAVGRIFDVLAKPLPPRKREGIFFVAGFHRPAIADALSWLTEELIPRVQERLPRVRFFVQDDDLARELAGNSPRVTLLGERELMQPGRIEGFALGLVPVRFGGKLEGPIQMLLSRGLSCVTTEHAAGSLPARFSGGIQLARSTRDFVETIGLFFEDPRRGDLASRDALRGMAHLYPLEQIRREIRRAIHP